MGRLDVILPEELEKKFRMEVAKRKGMKKGNIKKAVEEAIVKIRHAKRVNWDQIRGVDCRTLRDILGELWINIERKKWDEYIFSDVTNEDIEKILLLYKDLVNQTTFQSATKDRRDSCPRKSRDYKKIMYFFHLESD